MKLGDKAECRITGFVGTITATNENMNGCIQHLLTPRVDKDGKNRKGEYIDEQDVIVNEAVEMEVHVPSISFDLGSIVKDKVTGFKGVATSKVQFLNGCVRYCVLQSTLKEHGERPKGTWIDLELLVQADDKKASVTPTRTGGGQNPEPM